MRNNNEITYSVPSFEKGVNAIIRFIFFWRLLFVFVGLGFLAYITFQVWNNTVTDKYKNISLVFSFGSIVIGIFYAILNYEHNQIKYKNDVKNAKVVLAFNAASDWHKPSMLENLKITKKMAVEHKGLISETKAVDFYKILEENEPARTALVSIFNYFECISLGILHGVLDESFMKDYLHHVYTSYVNDYGFYIKHRRKIENAPQIWVNYTNMEAKWRS